MEWGDSHESVDVAVKIAFSEADKNTLEHKYRIYSHLHSKGVQDIHWIYGLFGDRESTDYEEVPYALVMAFAGQWLSSERLNGIKPH